MREAGDMVRVSIPFASGVAAAAFTGADVPAPLLLVSMAALCCAKPFFRKSGAFYALLFFFAGAFCHASSSLCILPPGGWLTGRIAQDALQALKAFIRGLPFRDERTAPLLLALLAGDRSGLDRSVVDSFREAGAAHVLALSGLHLGVIYGLLRSATSFIGGNPAARKVRSLLTVAFCAFYTMMAGAGPSLVRAFIFICINEFSSHCPERNRTLTDELAAALFIQLMLNPGVIKSVGFQLSYMSMASIALLFPVLKGFYPEGDTSRFDPLKRIWDASALSLSCQLFTAPLCWFYFHSVPMHFLLANLIALPLCSMLIPAAAVCIPLAAAGICPQFLFGICDTLSGWLIYVLEIISAM